MKIKAKALAKGDRVAIIAPSTGTDQKTVDTAIERIKSLDLIPIEFPTIRNNYGHLSAPDSMRAEDVNEAFRRDDIDGIICLKGGYGSARILNMLDFEMIKSNPKVFVGYSDITALHVAFNKICNLVTYHGPMASSNFTDPYTKDSLIKNLFTNEAPSLFENPEGEELKTISPGKGQGDLIGGNLSLLVSTLGSPYEVDTKGKILFIEEVNEPIYKVDGMLNSLALAGKFDDCNGIIFGTFTGCNRESKGYEGGFDLPLETVFNNTLLRFNKPILANFRAGHNFPQPTMAFGTRVTMDADKKEVIFNESGNI